MRCSMLLVLLVAQHVALSQAKQRNVLFLIADDLRPELNVSILYCAW